MIEYIYQVSICWAFFYLLYALWLRKETFFETNRWYLLGTLALGLLIPIIEFQLPLVASTATPTFQPANYLETITITGQAIETNLEAIVITPVKESWSAQIILLSIYWLGVLFFTGRFLLGLSQILRLRLNGVAVRKSGYTLIKTNKTHLPFSFMNYLFWSEKVDFNPEDTERILRHELCHIRDKHSFDVLFTELVSILLWCSPFTFFYKRELKNIHEYLADSAVLQDTPTQTYGQLLLKQSQSGLQIAQANNFIHSQLKKRILMMTKTKSQRSALLKYAAILPILLLLVFSISARNNLVELNSPTPLLSEHQFQDTIPPTTNSINNTDEVFQVVEEMPRFPGCEDKPEDERTACAQKNMLMHIYTNIKYPKEAREAGVQGTAVAKFIIEKDGSISNIDIVRPLSKEVDEEVKRVVGDMPKFIPGKQRGKAVRVRYLLPVKFKLEGDDAKAHTDKISPENKIKLDKFPGDPLYIVDGKEVPEVNHINLDDILSIDVLKGEAAIKKFGVKAKDGAIIITTGKEKISITGFAPVDEKEITSESSISTREEVFKVVEEMPIFPGADNVDAGNQKMLGFIYQNLKYPNEAKNAGVQGTVVVKFIITKEGRIEAPKLIRTIGAGTDEEVLRVIDLMSEIPENWTPGKQRGKAVNVEFNLPIKFKMDTGQAETPTPSTADNKPPLGQEAVFENVNIYPNPTASSITAELIVKNNLPTTVIVTDINGKQIYKEEFETNQIQITDLNLKDAADGIILLSFLQKGKLVLTKEVSLQR